VFRDWRFDWLTDAVPGVETYVQSGVIKTPESEVALRITT